jgi:hypothetical protein
MKDSICWSLLSSFWILRIYSWWGLVWPWGERVIEWFWYPETLLWPWTTLSPGRLGLPTPARLSACSRFETLIFSLVSAWALDALELLLVCPLSYTCFIGSSFFASGFTLDLCPTPRVGETTALIGLNFFLTASYEKSNFLVPAFEISEAFVVLGKSLFSFS